MPVIARHSVLPQSDAHVRGPPQTSTLTPRHRSNWRAIATNLSKVPRPIAIDIGPVRTPSLMDLQHAIRLLGRMQSHFLPKLIDLSTSAPITVDDAPLNPGIDDPISKHFDTRDPVTTDDPCRHSWWVQSHMRAQRPEYSDTLDMDYAIVGRRITFHPSRKEDGDDLCTRDSTGTVNSSVARRYGSADPNLSFARHELIPRAPLQRCRTIAEMNRRCPISRRLRPIPEGRPHVSGRTSSDTINLARGDQ